MRTKPTTHSSLPEGSDILWDGMTATKNALLRDNRQCMSTLKRHVCAEHSSLKPSQEPQGTPNLPCCRNSAQESRLKEQDWLNIIYPNNPAQAGGVLLHCPFPLLRHQKNEATHIPALGIVTFIEGWLHNLKPITSSSQFRFPKQRALMEWRILPTSDCLSHRAPSHLLLIPGAFAIGQRPLSATLVEEPTLHERASSSEQIGVWWQGEKWGSPTLACKREVFPAEEGSSPPRLKLSTAQRESLTPSPSPLNLLQFIQARQSCCPHR